MALLIWLLSGFCTGLTASRMMFVGCRVAPDDWIPVCIVFAFAFLLGPIGVLLIPSMTHD